MTTLLKQILFIIAIAVIFAGCSDHYTTQEITKDNEYWCVTTRCMKRNYLSPFDKSIYHVQACVRTKEEMDTMKLFYKEESEKFWETYKELNP